jgi:hypothetical protein
MYCSSKITHISISAIVTLPFRLQPAYVKMLAMTPSPASELDETSTRTPLSSQPPRVRRFEKLDGDDFRHPLDQQNTALLRSLPGLEMVARAVLGGPGFEQALYLENIGAALRVGPDQLPTLHRLLLQATACLNMDPPELYVRQVFLINLIITVGLRRMNLLLTKHTCLQPSFCTSFVQP